MPPSTLRLGTTRSSIKKPLVGKPKARQQPSYTEEDVKLALEMCSKDKPGAISIAKAAGMYGIPPGTLGHRARGKKPRADAHEHQQLLSAVQECALAKFCEIRGWRGEPVELAEIRDLAGEICGTKPGERWIYAFMERNPELKRRWAKRGETKRAKALNQANTDSFFELLAKAKQGVDADCIWNCDEKGIVENGGAIRRRVVVGSAQKDPKITADESRKMVTVLECVSATGGLIPPMVIHQGSTQDGEYIRSNPCGAALAASPSGWTSSENSLSWLKEVFDPETAAVANGRKRLLILDGHISHCSLNFILYAERKNITLFLLPPHTTHRLQPLDVGVFGPLAHAWQRVIKGWEAKGYVVRKNNLISLYSQARRQALTEENIRTAFKRCGIEPYDPSVVTEEDLAPAASSTFTASQPIPPTLASVLEIYEDPSHLLTVSTPSANEAYLDPALSAAHSDLLLIPLEDITNLSTRPSLKGLSVRRRHRPAAPTKYASNQQLRELVRTLYDQLDEDTEELGVAYAREALANIENGRIREKLNGKRSGRAKTTLLKTGAQVLTEAKAIEALVEVDRKRALSLVVKELGPLKRHVAKISTLVEKEQAVKRVQEENAEIQAAAGPMNAARKEGISVEKKLKTAQGRLTAALERRAKATTPSTRRIADKSCQNFRTQIVTLSRSLTIIEERYIAAHALHAGLIDQKQARLEELEAAEEIYASALRAEKEAKEAEACDDAADRARRAALPQRLKAAVPIWMGRMENALRMQDNINEDGEDFEALIDIEEIEEEPLEAEDGGGGNQQDIYTGENNYLDPEYWAQADPGELWRSATAVLRRSEDGGDED